MDKVHVADRGIDERLERGGADALNDACPQHAVVVAADGAGPGAAADEEANAKDKGMTLAPDAAGGHEKGAGEADAEQEVAGQQGDLGEVDLEPERERNGVGGQDGAEGRGKDGRDRKDEADHVALPERPVQRVVRVVRRLWDQDDGYAAAVVALEARRAVVRNLRPLGVVKVTRGAWQVSRRSGT